MEEMKFKTGQEVLVRYTDNDTWCYTLFSHYESNKFACYPFVTCGGCYIQCIPYKGNEHLLGTNNSPK